MGLIQDKNKFSIYRMVRSARFGSVRPKPKPTRIDRAPHEEQSGFTRGTRTEPDLTRKRKQARVGWIGPVGGLMDNPNFFCE